MNINSLIIPAFIVLLGFLVAVVLFEFKLPSGDRLFGIFNINYQKTPTYDGGNK